MRPHFKANPLSDFDRRARNKILSLATLALVNYSGNVGFLSVLSYRQTVPFHVLPVMREGVNSPPAGKYLSSYFSHSCECKAVFCCTSGVHLLNSDDTEHFMHFGEIQGVFAYFF